MLEAPIWLSPLNAAFPYSKWTCQGQLGNPATGRPVTDSHGGTLAYDGLW